METSKQQFEQMTVAIDKSETIDPKSRSIAEKRAIGMTHEQEEVGEMFRWIVNSAGEVWPEDDEAEDDA